MLGMTGHTEPQHSYLSLYEQDHLRLIESPVQMMVSLVSLIAAGKRRTENENLLRTYIRVVKPMDSLCSSITAPGSSQ